ARTVRQNGFTALLTRHELDRGHFVVLRATHIALAGSRFPLGDGHGGYSFALAGALSFRFRLVRPKRTAPRSGPARGAPGGSPIRLVRGPSRPGGELRSKRAEGRQTRVDRCRTPSSSRARLGRAGGTDTRASLGAQGEVRQLEQHGLPNELV